MDWFMGRSKKKDSFTNLSTSASETPIFVVDKKALDRSLVDKGCMKNLVQVPTGVDVDEWVATQTVFLFESINLLCSCLAFCCKPFSCPSMDGPNNVQYTWLDEKGKKCKMAACQYIDRVTYHIYSCIHNEECFPTKYGNTFPSNFRDVVENVHRLLCHILVHAYHSHLGDLAVLQLTPHYTAILHHFLSFNKVFKFANPFDISLFDQVFTYLESPIEAFSYDSPNNPEQCEGVNKENNKDPNDTNCDKNDLETISNVNMAPTKTNSDEVTQGENDKREKTVSNFQHCLAIVN